MKKTILLSTLLALSTPIFAKSIHYFGGQKEFLQKCRSCHGGSSVFVKHYTMKQWETFMDNNGSVIVDRHVNSRNEDAQKLKDYFESERYITKVPYLQIFFKRFAKDSDTNPYKKK